MARSLDFGTGFQLYARRLVKVRVGHGKATELCSAFLDVAAAPTNDLKVLFKAVGNSEFNGLQPFPEFVIIDSDDREICLIVDPLYFAVGPFAATAFLQSYERVVGQAGGGCQQFLTLDDGAEF